MQLQVYDLGNGYKDLKIPINLTSHTSLETPSRYRWSSDSSAISSRIRVREGTHPQLITMENLSTCLVHILESPVQIKQVKETTPSFQAHHLSYDLTETYSGNGM